MSIMNELPKWQDGDRFYAELVEAVDQTRSEDLQAFLLRLIVILAHSVCDQELLSEAIGFAVVRANEVTSQQH